jgi:site-specific DNA-adenine methylase
MTIIGSRIKRGWNHCDKNYCFGGQSRSSKQIASKLDKIPHKTYVEPFLGRGDVYRSKAKHSEREILNDIDCKRVKVAKSRICDTKDQKRCDTMKKAQTSCGKDYKQFLGKYDNKDTLFYLDPPYHDASKQGQDAYKTKGLDFDRFVSAVKNVKQAKVAISYSNNKQFRKEFCKNGFRCHKIRANIFKNKYHDLLAVKK